jgi:hypothetical protein
MSFRHVLVVLDGEEEPIARVLTAAVRLAEVERARLTLTRTTDPGRVIRWLRPCAALSLLSPMGELLRAEADLQQAAGHQLGRAAEFVPDSIPVTTLVLAPDTRRALRALLALGTYDVLVATADLLTRIPRLKRELASLGISVLALSPPAASATRAERAAGVPRPIPLA